MRALGRQQRPGDNVRTLPGDEHIQDARFQLTHATDIEAPPAMS